MSGVVEPLSFDHKPNNELETKRIEAAGGWVMFNRVNGNLALSRALGDYIFKKNDQKKLDEQIVIGKNLYFTYYRLKLIFTFFLVQKLVI